MTQLTKDDVLRLAQLTNIDIDDAKATALADDMQNIIGYVEMLNDADVTGLKPTEQVTGLVNVMRKDEIIDYGIEQADLLKNAPSTHDGQIKVRRML